jgi:hypothetical protein
MPLVYRAMLADGDRPQVGQTALSLGVRVPPDENADVAVSADGMAEPRSGGMSVAPAWRMLPVHRIPRRLRPKFPRAAGKNGFFLWRRGEGPFTEGPFAERLLFRPDPEKPNKHGFVEPAARMPVEEYQAALAATRDQWVIDEE